MVNIGSGGAYSGICYTDEEGTIRTGVDYILNRLSMAQVNHYKEIFYSIKGIACHKPQGRIVI